MSDQASDPQPTPETAVSGGRYTTFVVRIWSREGADALTHGQITAVKTREGIHFRDLQRLLDFITGHLGAAQTDRPRSVRRSQERLGRT